MTFDMTFDMKDTRGAEKRLRMGHEKWGRKVMKLKWTDLLPPKSTEEVTPQLSRWSVFQHSRKHADAIAYPGHSRFVRSAVNLPRIRTRSSDRTPKRKRTRAGINKGKSHGSTCGYCWPQIGTRMTERMNATRFARKIQAHGQSDLATDPFTNLREKTVPEIRSEIDDHNLEMWATEGKVFCWYCGEWADPLCTECGTQNPLPDAELDIPRHRVLDLSIMA
jgi:hypothetical protein